MPVEIRELHIRVKINERENNNRNTISPNARRQERDASEDAIIAECVEQTLAILERKEER
jgi:hypothetical protein